MANTATATVATESESLRSIVDQCNKHASEINSRASMIFERLRTPTAAGSDAPVRSGIVGATMDLRSTLLDIETKLGDILDVLGN